MERLDALAGQSRCCYWASQGSALALSKVSAAEGADSNASTEIYRIVNDFLGGGWNPTDYLRCFETGGCSYGFVQIVTQLRGLMFLWIVEPKDNRPIEAG